MQLYRIPEIMCISNQIEGEVTTNALGNQLALDFPVCERVVHAEDQVLVPR